MGRRILSVWFPRLASERHQRAQWGGEHLVAWPFAVIADERGAQRVSCLNARAETAGLTRGMALTDARAIAPNLRTVPAMAGRDATFLSGLRRWAERYSPHVAEDGIDGLTLDVTGCTHLFAPKSDSVAGRPGNHPIGENGEAGMLADISARLARFGLTARLGLADTKGAAWGLARYGPGSAIAPAGKTREAIGGLPLAALRIADDAVGGLMRLGVKTVWEMALLPRASLAKRFGTDVVRRLDQALGAEPEPVSPAAPEPVFAARMSLSEPVGLTRDVLAVAARLMARIAARLDDTGMGARCLRLTIRRVDHSEDSVDIGLARPSRDPDRILPLFERPVEKLDAGFGIERIRLQAIAVEPLAPVQHSGIGSVNRTGAEGEKLAELLGRIGNRIGFDRVQRFLPADSHIPEKAFSISAAAYSQPASWPPDANATPAGLDHAGSGHGRGGWRPAQPAFSWRRQRFDLSAAVGPERITPEWWLDDPAWRTGLRDYWRIETEEGRRLWLFHTPQAPAQSTLSGWYVHGEFA